MSEGCAALVEEEGVRWQADRGGIPGVGVAASWGAEPTRPVASSRSFCIPRPRSHCAGKRCSWRESSMPDRG
jgi:hypothetical protein